MTVWIYKPHWLLHCYYLTTFPHACVGHGVMNSQCVTPNFVIIIHSAFNIHFLHFIFVHFAMIVLQSCQADLVKDNGHKYFLSVLADAYMPVSNNCYVYFSQATSIACMANWILADKAFGRRGGGGWGVGGGGWWGVGWGGGWGLPLWLPRVP